MSTISDTIHPSHVKLTECPRDAMQGLHDFVPTSLKAAYINLILKAGFDTVDFGSFVSPKAIPQMRDTAELMDLIDLSNSDSKLLAIIANTRGAEDAAAFEKINYLGFPFSVSETFQQRNANSSIADSLTRVEEIKNICDKHNKTPLVYLSMGFGNPYGDEWSAEIVEHWADQLIERGITNLSLADTVGVSTPENISYLFKHLSSTYPDIAFGVHLHSTPQTRKEKIAAAYSSGCRRFDSAIKGFGGCPMAADDLTGNIATESIISYLEENGVATDLDKEAFNEAFLFSSQIFH